jgi:phage shock protein C
MSIPPERNRLYRSRRNRIVGGVCGGIAERFGWNPTVVRILFVVSIVLPGPQVLIYLLMWLTIPLEPRPGQTDIVDGG